ncbi:DUF4252 domain-containing protein [Patiriisocius hiemis]|uniref:DUF4252 domain-containing protein n=1 Tax=Patiriisocius hiemis TaxID=3075604 RepID=A0ABU2Y962_9FLAO|nr:DUF4252 domain-containing protein [Constantimarinum sp. W242]MDT0554718.1 DUF4252 domain-containing protein [Constantimarinum sp. W242]
MKKLAIILILLVAPLATSAQGFFDAYEDEKDVTAVVVTKNMFKLLAKIDIESDDPEVQEYMNLVNNLENIKIFITENPATGKRMAGDVEAYISKNKSLSELMRVKDDGQNIKFYSKEGKNENFVSELLMFLEGSMDGKDGTVIMSITGNIDLKQVSKLTKDLNVPGTEGLKKLDKKN